MTSTIQQLSDPFGQVAFRDAGVPRGAPDEPVVLLHGVGMQSAAWAPQIDALSRAFHVIALDLPGHGGSDQLPSGSDLEMFLDWFLAALDALGIRRANLVGHSMGALIAGGFAIRHPDRVARVALLNGVFRRDDAARQSVIERAALIGTGSFDVQTPLRRWFSDTPSDRAARADVGGWLSEVDVEGYATAYTAFAHGDALFSDSYDKIRCPLLALTGGDDPNSTPAMSWAMAKAALHGRAIIIEHHRHMVNLTAPEAVNAALVDWLNWPCEQGEGI